MRPDWVETLFYKGALAYYGYQHFPMPTLTQVKKAKVIAHRGLYDNQQIYENTCSAFESCLALGVYGIEFDVRWTRDDVPVVIHDADCRRLFHQKNCVRELTFEALRARAPDVPSLAEVVTRFGKRLHFMIELKQEAFAFTDQHVAILQKILVPLSAGEDYHLMSLVPAYLNQLKPFPPTAILPIAQVRLQGLVTETLSAGYGGFTAHYALLREKQRQRLQAAHCPVGTGQIDCLPVLYRELGRNIDWLFTNHPDKIQHEINRLTQTLHGSTD